jgi:hypothetical protein
MDSIPTPQQPDQVLADVARRVAFELKRPWRIEELRAKASEAYQMVEPPSAALGLPRVQVDEWMLRRTYEDVMQTGERMDALPPGEEKPAPERIEAALGAFTSEQWESLLEGFSQVEGEALLSFIRQNADRLKQKFGAGKVLRIKDGTTMRTIKLWLVENRTKLVPISDVDWAIVLPDLVSEENIARATNHEGSGRPAKGRSVAELGSDRSIAQLLSKRDEQTGHEMNVSPYQVKLWRERMESLPFAQYAADVGADDGEKGAAARIDYWAMIRDTAVFKKYLDAREHREN